MDLLCFSNYQTEFDGTPCFRIKMSGVQVAVDAADFVSFPLVVQMGLFTFLG